MNHTKPDNYMEHSFLGHQSEWISYKLTWTKLTLTFQSWFGSKIRKRVRPIAKTKQASNEMFEGVKFKMNLVET